MYGYGPHPAPMMSGPHCGYMGAPIGAPVVRPVVVGAPIRPPVSMYGGRNYRKRTYVGCSIF